MLFVAWEGEGADLLISAFPAMASLPLAGAGSSRTYRTGDPIFFHHMAILWTRLHGVLAVDRSDDSHLRMTLDGKGKLQ